MITVITVGCIIIVGILLVEATRHLTKTLCNHDWHVIHIESRYIYNSIGKPIGRKVIYVRQCTKCSKLNINDDNEQ